MTQGSAWNTERLKGKRYFVRGVLAVELPQSQAVSQGNGTLGVVFRTRVAFFCCFFGLCALCLSIDPTTLSTPISEPC